MLVTIDKILSKDPAIIQGYKSATSNALSDSTKFSSPAFVVKSVGCVCGSDLMYLELVQKKHLLGVCVKSTVVEYQPPVYTVCAACKRSRILFDAVIHGWRGEAGLVKDESMQRLVKHGLKPGRVVVAYSYSKASDYDTLLENGIDDLENYFDSFSIFYSLGNAADFSEIISVQCK